MQSKLRKKIFEIIFEADTRTGKIFDITLLAVILFSVVVVVLESVPSLSKQYKNLFYTTEWVLTIIFSAEYILRIYSASKRFRYITSFYGIIDLLAILPVYIGILFSALPSLLIIRVFRLLRVFRILKITRYLQAARTLGSALKASRAKISVFLFAVLLIVLLVGTLMYLIEGEDNGFISIPQSMYWAIVTLTTVGYGDLTPHTTLGQFLSSIVMVLGYAIIAVPTGIITVELARMKPEKITTQVCPSCMKEGHEQDACFCKYCGAILNED